MQVAVGVAASGIAESSRIAAVFPISQTPFQAFRYGLSCTYETCAQHNLLLEVGFSRCELSYDYCILLSHLLNLFNPFKKCLYISLFYVEVLRKFYLDHVRWAKHPYKRKRKLRSIFNIYIPDYQIIARSVNGLSSS